MGRSTETFIFPALTGVVFEKAELVCRYGAPSPALSDVGPRKLSVAVGVVRVGPCFRGVFAEFEELLQPVLLGLSLGEPCRDLNSEARYLEFDGHDGF